MKALIVGSGRVGSFLAGQLVGQGHEVVIVDREPRSFKMLGEDLVVQRIATPETGKVQATLTAKTRIRCIVGSGSDEELLKTAGIQGVDALVAVTDNDYVNLMAAVIAKELYQVPRVIIGIINPRRLEIAQELGVEAICPLTLGAQAMFESLIR
ncbi:MAG: NAD-binding protein [candidate division NC10 bacterium]|nr:NAD-binding protein [candidate division NC10 bacterium]